MHINPHLRIGCEVIWLFVVDGVYIVCVEGWAGVWMGIVSLFLLLGLVCEIVLLVLLQEENEDKVPFFLPSFLGTN